MSFIGAVDPMYAIDYTTLCNATGSSKAIKGFTSAVKTMSNNSYLGNFMDDDDSMFGSGITNNSSIYKSLYNMSNAYPSSLNTSLNSTLDILNNNDMYLNPLQSKLENAMKDLFNYSNDIKINDTSLLSIVNDKNLTDVLELEDAKIFMKENFDLKNPSLVIYDKTNGTEEEIFINDINIFNASDKELSIYTIYNSMIDNKFQSTLKNIIKISDDKTYTLNEKENLIKFARVFSDYNKVNKDYNDMQKEIDKQNEDNEKIEALFDLIDAINEMYSNYNREQRENYKKKNNKY